MSLFNQKEGFLNEALALGNAEKEVGRAGWVEHNSRLDHAGIDFIIHWMDGKDWIVQVKTSAELVFKAPISKYMDNGVNFIVSMDDGDEDFFAEYNRVSSYPYFSDEKKEYLLDTMIHISSFRNMVRVRAKKLLSGVA